MQSVTCEEYEYLQVGQPISCNRQQSNGEQQSAGWMQAAGVKTAAPVKAPAGLSETAGWIWQQTAGQGADVVIDCVASPASLSDALLAVRPGGQILEVGNPKGDMDLPKDIYWKLLRKQVRVTGTWNSSYTQEDADDWHTTLAACADGRLKLSELITHRLSFEELDRGLLIMRDKMEYHNKVMIVRP
jgi:L-iditol 2-dehydrogenase